MTLRRFHFPVIDPREHNILAARIRRDGVTFPDPSQPTGERTVRLARRDAWLYAGTTLAQNATQVGTVEARRVVEPSRVSRRSFEKYLRAETRQHRHRRRMLNQELESAGTSRKRRDAIGRELRAMGPVAPLARTVAMAADSFNAAQRARARAQRAAVA